MSRDQAKPTPKHAKAVEQPNPTLDALVAGKAAGTVKFDDRGNAIWEISTAGSGAARKASIDPLKRLDNPALSIAEQQGGGGRVAARANPLGTIKGYDPYESGELARPFKRSKKKDLRKLGEWMKLRRQASKNKQDP